MVCTPTQRSFNTSCAACQSQDHSLPLVAGRLVTVTRCPVCESRLYCSAELSTAAPQRSDHQHIRGFSPVKHLPYQRPHRLQRLLSSIEDLHECHLDPFAVQAKDFLLMLIAVPLGPEFQPLGNSVPTSSCKLSSHGIDFFCSQAPECSYWLLDFGPTGFPSAQIIVKPVRTRLTEIQIYNISATVVTQLDFSG